VSSRPILRTARLLLGGFALDDAAELQRLAGAREIADTTLAIPHPYHLEDALSWIRWLDSEEGARDSVNFAIRLLRQAQLIGSIGLRDIDPQHGQGELGFWIGKDWWGQGYAREAARAVIQFGFESLNLNRVCAHHMSRNAASGRVLLAAGMHQEGVLRQRVQKWGVYEDVVLYAVVRDDWK
jgi:ribosomal-protein-alanine N-acetyltransferase